ncbi:hypothetical protein ACHAW5_002986 [Stephanodiscus triporus]|uniref:Uncharacterized protein n=1 Tax=Stephanodiscus triporus TaxID=2934178 RepID=A0ABD3NCN6_9STRA
MNVRHVAVPTSVEEARAFVSGYGDGAPCYTVGACVLAHHPTGLRCGGIEVASVHFGRTIADPDPRHLVDRLLDAGAPILGCAGGLMIEHPLVREHVVAIDGTEDSVMGLSKDLVERLMDELREKLDGIGVGTVERCRRDATRVGPTLTFPHQEGLADKSSRAGGRVLRWNVGP